MSLQTVKEYRSQLSAMLTDKEYEIYNLQHNPKTEFIKKLRKQKKALEYAILLIDKELLEQGADDE